METLDTCAMKARTEALRAECLRLRLLSARRQRQSVELRTACVVVGQACRASIELSKDLMPKLSKSSRMDLPRAVVHALEGVGIKAFVFEPPPDSAPNA
jgi:hypothetical protein